MDAERLDRVEELFHEALEREAPERAAFLDGACRGDLELRAEVESLLAHGGAPTRAAFPATAPQECVRERGPLQEGPGTVIGPYKLLQLLGEGGFGAVYMAEQRAPVRRRVALKVIKLGMDTRQVVGRFEAERQALALMDHPNIAKVLDAGATQTGRPFFVMELVRGVPITEYCDKAGMSTDGRLRLFVLVCRAVQHAHQKGIVHRDLKPSNILVTLHDGVPVPKVIDFGIAKATNQELTERTVFTEFRQFIGTPEYMSPEQAELSGLDIDTRADVYSLGVLLYELLTGTTPVDAARLRGAGYDELQRILREEEAVRPSTRLSTMGEEAAVIAHRRQDEPERLARTLRGDLDWIVLKALEKDRTRRYESAVGFAMDVERYLQDEPVLASPPSRAYKLRKFARRNRGAVAASFTLAGVLLLGIAGTTAGCVRARGALEGEQEARAAAERSSRLAREEAERQRALARFFEESLLSSGPWSFESAAPARVVDLLDIAAARLEAGALSDQPEGRAVLARAIGGAYIDRDRWAEGLGQYRRAAEWLGDGAADPLTLSRVARELDRIDAESYFELDVGVEVGPLRERALAALEPLVAAQDPAVAEELLDWSHVVLLRGESERAAELLAALLELVRARGLTSPGRSLVEFNLACAEARRGDREAARRHYASAARDLREVVARGDSEAAAEWLSLCEHPEVGLAMEASEEQGVPLAEVAELALAGHGARNLATAELLWSAASVLGDIESPERSYELLLQVEEIAREFGQNRLMLGLVQAELAELEWSRGATRSALARCREARELLAPTRGEPYRTATLLLVEDLVERIEADPGAAEVAQLAQRVTELAEEAGEGVERAWGGRRLAPWWEICGSVSRMHAALAEHGAGAEHAARAREWSERARANLAPFLERPFPRGHDIACTALAGALLALGDATHAELETARELATLGDAAAGGRLATPVAALARALHRLGDDEGAVREARRALALTHTSGPVRGLEERLARYEAALDGGR